MNSTTSVDLHEGRDQDRDLIAAFNEARTSEDVQRVINLAEMRAKARRIEARRNEARRNGDRVAVFSAWISGVLDAIKGPNEAFSSLKR